MVFGPSLANLRRLRQITAVVARHGLDHFFAGRRKKRSVAKKLNGVNTSTSATDAQTQSNDNEEELPGLAQRFRSILEELGPTFIKFGQVLSTRPDILPPGFAEALRGLQDDCPPLASDEALCTVESELGKPINELFAEFDPIPVASASIGQVHKATLHSGEEVAVKIRRPKIREQILRDLDFLRYLARLAEAIIEESGLVAPQDIVTELENAFLSELDFEREARNMRRFARNLASKQRSYVVPALYDDLCTRSVLTMEFIKGERLADLSPNHNKKKIAANIVSSSFEQLFIDGFFHADPHPGNAFVLPDDRIALIDFGLIGELTYSMRETLMVLVVGIATHDADTVARLLYRLGVADERVSLFRLREACSALFSSYLKDRDSVANIQATRLMSDLLQLATRFHVHIPSEYAIIARAGATVEGIIRQLDPTLEVLDTAKPYLRKLIEEQFSWPNFGEGAMKNIMRLRSMMRDIPLSLTQVLMDLESGKLQIQVKSNELETIGRNINSLGLATFSGFIACGLITGSFFILARYKIEIGGWPIIPIAGLFFASMLFGASLGWYFISPHLQKISLIRLFKRWRRDVK
ncbi:MAG: AarF/ABC1/UbiB kinase family protein [Deltaproteobacteria bacterium]|nr:AarF/ABC1/UbiB kinase family protein [Deltaproteobacteria bacterium]